ncbi:MAG: enoyl-CoA hydratase/isomerase family protein [Maricaulaceae bacterium]
MNLPETKFIELERDGAWLTIWFNQPEKRNPMTDEMVAELMQVFDVLEAPCDIRGVTLRGRGGVFCAGGDLKSFKNSFQVDADPEAILKMSRGVAVLFDRFNALPQVTIVLIEGAAMAGGFGLTCCADVVICETGAKFAMTETMIGLSPAQIAPFIIQRLGYSTARRLMLTGARFKGDQACELGLADFTADDVAGLEAHEAQIRNQVLRCAPGAVADTKSLILELPTLSREQQIEAAAKNFTGRMLSDEAKDGIASFFEKRKPNWAE